MKKLFVVGVLLLTPYVVADDDIIMLPQQSAIQLEYDKSTQELINVDKMKKSEKIKEAQEENQTNATNKIKLDSRQINHQRALNYTTKFTMPMP